MQRDLKSLPLYRKTFSLRHFYIKKCLYILLIILLKIN